MRYADRSRGRPFSKDPSVIRFEGRYLMYYSLPPYGDGRSSDGWAIGVAESGDLEPWQRLSTEPFFPNGRPGAWNESESGHPGVLVDEEGTVHLYYQGNNNGGQTWTLSRVRVTWREGMPVPPHE